MSAPTPTGFEPRTNAGRALLETLDMVAWFDEDTDYPATIRAIEAEVLEGVAERVRALQTTAHESHERFVASKDWSLADKVDGREAALYDVLALLSTKDGS